MNTAIGLGKKIILGSLFSFLRIGCLVCVCVCVCVYTYIHMVHISAGEYYFLGGSEQFCGRLDLLLRNYEWAQISAKCSGHFVVICVQAIYFINFFNSTVILIPAILCEPQYQTFRPMQFPSSCSPVNLPDKRTFHSYFPVNFCIFIIGLPYAHLGY